ncbi:aspartokinase, alpha and beta subunits [Campylobacter blaseri]|uniref:Aspartokinase n=1 Tax=Campylobacter blaseri TaxID=2042961 RepID=A0A2P8R221_9BACT|nr:aspartate kinase [Campylobacter blaseri]PSM52544.1 aspartate kinase [Campylobacter blaseri]PSM54192.1 aspartate kinase [Campylobacter blaseri]QKF85843.1 aspartokinase, alpha and beta subunits [Campylobacter blaseri]
MLLVQKYGGTSVGTLERIEVVAQRVKKTKDEGNDVVVVVSAMSGETNKLIDYAHHFSKNPRKRELDMLLSAGERVTSSLLSIALNELGCEAIAFSGRQAGMHTDSFHTKAKIESINPKLIKEAISQGKVVVVAGFQGINEKDEVTTLGRGGSDLSAVALAGALKADLCEIFTDVDGVYTTDPRIEPKARKLDKVTYDEMLELASLGAKVLQNRSVELAKKLNINLVTRSSFNNHEGTLITGEKKMESAIISGIALDRNQAIVSVRNVDDKPGVAAKIFEVLSKEEINVDMIIQNIGSDGVANIGFTVPENELDRALEALKELDSSFVIDSNKEVVKVSIVGIGMKSNSGIASKAFSVMSENGINIQMISTSEIRISVIVNEKYGELAVRALHEAYELDK